MTLTAPQTRLLGMPRDGQHGDRTRSSSKAVKFPTSPYWYREEHGDFIGDPSGGTHFSQGYKRLPDGYVPGTEGYQENGVPTPGIQAFLDKGYKLWTPDMGFDVE